MEKRKYRAAVVGLGFIGAADQVSGDAIGQRVEDLHGTHAQALAGNPRVELVAGSSRDPGRRTRFEERLGVPNTYARWQDMLEREALDIVSVATNSPYHAEIALACARSGIRCVFCEKPITTRLSDADELIEVCKEHGTLLVVNHNRRWEPMYLEVRTLVGGGAIGTVQHVVATWPAGRLGNVGTHVFDALRLMLDREAVAVTGQVNDTGRPDCRGSQYRDPGGWGVIEFEDGIRGLVDAAESISSPFPMEIVLRGSTGKISLCGFSASVAAWGQEASDIVVEDDGKNSVDRAVAEIVQCLDENRPSGSSGEDGRATLEIIMGFHASHRRGGARVALPLEGEDRDSEVLVG